MAKKGYLLKNIAFKEDDPDDMKLYLELQSKAHGDFSRISKELWREWLNNFKGEKK